jgi:hypothetical protein
MLTHRIKRDPSRHLLYDNLEDFVHAAEKWLTDPARRRQHTLGILTERPINFKDAAFLLQFF